MFSPFSFPEFEQKCFPRLLVDFVTFDSTKTKNPAAIQYNVFFFHSSCRFFFPTSSSSRLREQLQQNGNAAFKKQLYREAINFYNQVIQLDPCEKLKKWEEALASYEEYLKLDPNDEHVKKLMVNAKQEVDKIEAVKLERKMETETEKKRNGSLLLKKKKDNEDGGENNKSTLQNQNQTTQFEHQEQQEKQQHQE
jgi:tetratricopeptide (TPR) repeat protein